MSGQANERELRELKAASHATGTARPSFASRSASLVQCSFLVLQRGKSLEQIRDELIGKLRDES